MEVLLFRLGLIGGLRMVIELGDIMVISDLGQQLSQCNSQMEV
jgi:hypothetical protein